MCKGGDGQWRDSQPSSLACDFSLGKGSTISVMVGRNVILSVECVPVTTCSLSVLCLDLVSLVFFLVHAAVIAINEAIDHRVAADTFTALKNPNAMLVNLEEALAPTYQDVLYQAKQDKMTNAKNRVQAQHLFN